MLIEATATISNGSITNTNITNIGLGYSVTAPPSVLAPFPDIKDELITNITAVQGFAGIVTGIGTTSGIGTALALKFHLHASSFTGLTVNYPIYISDTQIGTGVTSIYAHDESIVGIGTTFLDNVYNISGVPWNDGSFTGIITCNIKSDTSVIGLTSTGNSMVAVGRFSWGKLSGFTRGGNPISIAVTGKTINSGLTTFPTIQRRGTGFRDTGAIDPFYS